MRIGLSGGQWLSFRGDFRGMRISCRSGALWLTQAGDRHDYLLHPGDAFVVRNRGMIVAESWRRATLELTTPLHEPEPPGVPRGIVLLMCLFCHRMFAPSSRRGIVWHTGSTEICVHLPHNASSSSLMKGPSPAPPASTEA